jgi:hypothetical protein
MIRLKVIGVTLIVAAIVWWLAPDSAEVVAANIPPREPTRVEMNTQRLAAIPKLDAKVQRFDGAMDKLFADRKKVEDSPSPAPSVARAPALPENFQLIGKAQIDGVWKAIIAVDGKSYLAGAGDKVVDRFVVEKLAPPSLVVVDLGQGGARFDLAIGNAP